MVVGSHKKENFNDRANQARMKIQLNRSKIPNIVLVGATGSGKSTVASQLAQVLGFGVIDIDEAIEERSGRKISEIFKKEGLEGFRRAETRVIGEISDILNHVVVPGAGALENNKNFEALKKLGPLIWLATPTSEIVNRLLMKPDELRQRPLLAHVVEVENKDERAKALFKIIDEKMAGRRAAYAKADMVLESRHSTSEINAMLIKTMLVKYGSPKPEANSI